MTTTATLTLELHILHTYPVNRLNRGEDGSTKSITFGGTPRVRISSQAQKRAERHHHLRFGTDTPQGVRIKQPQDVVTRAIAPSHPDLVNKEHTQHVIRTALSSVYGEYDDKNRLKAQVFLGDDELQRITDLLLPQLDRVTNLQDLKDRTAAAAVVLNDRHSVTASPDLALYGRFLATTDGWDIEAASYTHALSTHRANNVTDFFTAVDDLTGHSVHLGQSDISAPTMYRMAVVDISQLQRNLAGRDVQDVIHVWATRAVSSSPSGGQHGTFAATQPDYVLVVLRRGGQPLTYAPAFEQAVYRDQQRSIAQVSAERLEDYARRLPKLYGQNGQLSAQRVTMLTLPAVDHDSIDTAASLTIALDTALTVLR